MIELILAASRPGQQGLARFAASSPDRERSDLKRSNLWRKGAKLLAAAVMAGSLAGCLGYDGELAHGFQVDPQALADVRNGSSAEQVLVVLGTPSTTSTVGGDAWYYITQKTDHSLAFLPPHMVEQHIYAVYFDKGKKVARIANYGMEDGKLIDFSNRQTVTNGAESTFLKNLAFKLSPFG